MKRKIKKFADGGLASLTQGQNDIAQAANIIERATQKIKGDPGGDSGLTRLDPNLLDGGSGFRNVSGLMGGQQQMARAGANQNNAFPLQSALSLSNRTFKKGGTVKAKPKAIKSTSKRGDGIAQRGKTRGKMV